MLSKLLGKLINELNLFVSERFRIEEKNRLALDRVNSISVMRAPTDLKALMVISSVLTT